MSLIIAGERSGVGKTTVTLALLAALAQQNSKIIQSFKVGPDYIDPMFHRRLTGRPCRNLDVILTSETYVQDCFAHHTAACDYVVIEGVMGLFDGASSSLINPAIPWDRGSTAHIADLLQLPIVLVVNAGGTSRSIAALVHGYQTYAPQLRIAGVVLNRVSSERHLELLSKALSSLNMPLLGVFYRQTDITIPDRHLGLVPTDELPELPALIQHLATLGQASFVWDHLLPLLSPPIPQPLTSELDHSTPKSERLTPKLDISTSALDYLTSKLQLASSQPQHQPEAPCRLAIAQDAAFNFYYADNLDILASAGFELVAWSPLKDRELPNNIHGLYLGGGFPEMFAAELSANQSLLQQLHHLIVQGLPTYAECGGLMYLCQAIVDFEQNSYPMLGILPTTAEMGKRLTLGYRQIQHRPGLVNALIANDQLIWGHEFHRSTLTPPPTLPLYHLTNYDGSNPQVEGWQCLNVYASYVHLHFGGCLSVPRQLLALSQAYRHTNALVSQPTDQSSKIPLTRAKMQFLDY